MPIKASSSGSFFVDWWLAPPRVHGWQAGNLFFLGRSKKKPNFSSSSAPGALDGAILIKVLHAQNFEPAGFQLPGIGKARLL